MSHQPKISVTPRHLLMCADPSEKCASRQELRRAWNYLKHRLKHLGLSRKAGLLKTRTECLHICDDAGPLLVVYPDNVWYQRCDPEAIERIIHEHLLNGRVVEELRCAAPICALAVACQIAANGAGESVIDVGPDAAAELSSRKPR